METFKEILGYEGLYQVSNFGNVKSLFYKEKKREKILKPSPNGHGYLQLVLSKNKVRRNYRVHILVAMAFLGHKPNGTTQFCIDHIDNDIKNNNSNNLQILNNRDNINKSNKKQTSKFRGVSIHKTTGLWRASIQHNKKRICLGYFKTEEEASLNYEIQLNNIIYGK